MVSSEVLHDALEVARSAYARRKEREEREERGSSPLEGRDGIITYYHIWTYNPRFFPPPRPGREPANPFLREGFPGFFDRSSRKFREEGKGREPGERDRIDGCTVRWCWWRHWGSRTGGGLVGAGGFSLASPRWCCKRRRRR